MSEAALLPQTRRNGGRGWRRTTPRRAEQWVGFHKAGAEKKGITYKQAVDEALCFGWIDAVRRGGHATWSIRFTPRKKGSIWSAVNIRRIGELNAEGRVAPAGLAAYEGRDPEKQKKYSFENRDVVLAPDYEKRFRADKSRLGVVRSHAALLSPPGGLVGDERQAGGDARAAPGDADRQLRRRPQGQAR